MPAVQQLTKSAPRPATNILPNEIISAADPLPQSSAPARCAQGPLKAAARIAGSLVAPACPDLPTDEEGEADGDLPITAGEWFPARMAPTQIARVTPPTMAPRLYILAMRCRRSGSIFGGYGRD